ncbi:MAG: TonB-dependent receptor [Oxalobacteraceae bacterium]|nr:TonB-dependent receptor [Oxalobacteraceae bacterium]
MTFSLKPWSAALLAACAGGAFTAAAQAADSTDTRLQEVVVQGGSAPGVPKELPAVVEAVTRQQMADGINVINTEDALKYLPSIQIRKRFIGDTNGIVASRSSGTLVSARSLVYADNLLLSNLLGNSYSYPPRWGMVTPEEIERVDVIYGPFSALYPGNAMGAVINMTTRMPSKFEAHAKAQAFGQNFKLYGTDDSFSGKQFSAALGNRAGALSWWLNANHLDSRGQPMSFLTQSPTIATQPGDTPVSGAHSDLDPSGKPRTILGATGIADTIQDQAKLKLAYDISPTLSASYTLGLWQGDNTTGAASYLKDGAGNPVYSGKVNFGGKQYTLKDTDLNPGSSEQQHWMHGLSLATHSGGSWDWEALASAYDYSRDLSRAPTAALPAAASGGPGRLTDMSGTGWRTLDLRGTWRPNPVHEANFGYHFDHYRLDTEVSGTANWRNGPASGQVSAFAGKTETQALYAQDAWRFAPNWKATVGGRWENWQAFDGAVSNPTSTLPFAKRNENFFSPKLALSFQPAPAWALRASLAQAYRMPSVAELYQGTISNNAIVRNDPNLKPEQALSGELTAERELGSGLLRVSYFQENASDALYSQTNLATNVTNIQNVDRIRTRGLELAYQGTDVGLRGLDLAGSITYANSVITRNDANPATVGNRQPRVPNWRATVSATYRQNAQLSYALAGRYSGRQFNTLDNSDSNADTYGGASEFFVLDLRLRYKVDRQWSAALGVDNLTNRQYYVAHPYPQRTLSAELKYDF